MTGVSTIIPMTASINPRDYMYNEDDKEDPEWKMFLFNKEPTREY